MAVATLFSPVMSSLTGNTGGAVQSLPAVNLAGARERIFVGTLVLAAQASGSVVGVARIPLQSVVTGITVITDTSLGSATIALGDTNNGALYMAAQTLTNTNTPTRVGLAATHGAPITTGYDCVSGLSTKSYEDIVLTTGAASLPASGNLAVIIEYALD
jgi:hypothetical protein